MATEVEYHNTIPPVVEVKTGVRRWLLRGVFLSASCLTLVVGAATLAGFNAQYGWRFELLCNFRVQYFWALTAAAIVLFALRRWAFGAIAATLAALNLAVIVPLYFGPDSVPSLTGDARILSLNVHFLNRNYQATLNLIEAEQPDVIFLMEITPGWANALKVLDKKYPHSEVLPSHSPSGVGLFSRYPIADLEVKRLPGIGLPTLVAGIDLPEGRITVVATHPASPSTADEMVARNMQLASVAEIAASRSGPVMVVGDLNTTSWSPYFEDLITVSGLRDSRLGYGVEATWPWLPLPLRIPLDHCLVSPQISIANRRVGPAIGSDHRPIIVDFSY